MNKQEMYALLNTRNINDNTATVWLKIQDLLQLLEENGAQITLFDACRCGGICRPPDDPSKLNSPYTLFVNQTTMCSTTG